MNIETLRLFVNVAHRLSFAAVAEEYGVDPSSVSRSISNLEGYLGLRLFSRTTRKVTLTEAGEIYFKRMQSILEEYDQAEEQAKSISQTPSGTLRFTASVAFGEKVIVPLVPVFNARFPEIKLELLFTDGNLDLVSSGIDLAIRLAPNLSGDMVATKLMDTQYRVVASPSYVESHPTLCKPQDLQEHSCTVFALPGYRDEWRFRSKNRQEQGGIERIQIQPRNTVSSAISILTLAINHTGPALLANWLVDEAINSGHLIDVFPDYDISATNFETSAWLVYPSRTYLPQKVRVMIDFLKENLQY
ncbi:LysR family transcriptional regulator [Marinomonas epiphytica]